MVEPIVIAQTADEHTHEAKRAWVQRTAAEACERGAIFARVTAHETIPDLILYEGWNVRPDDQGEPRFAVTYAQS